ncbi:hypothetical protein KsCSTR_00130 [Candidatus Kuenenia stuttgartiensis]|uniref:Uncharacterized protein n=1 Tax=Kuenenia stuttgartiensis TaxID=174633 RepID=Q1PVC9_KUEST|nr:hypothetical protein KsCSTR_00130 [Candidatus Kuenenia stuttgartiensis]CAJ71177.1 unknown protein [Candidatus Kuenenia stuttgartiensis]
MLRLYTMRQDLFLHFKCIACNVENKKALYFTLSLSLLQRYSRAILPVLLIFAHL